MINKKIKKFLVRIYKIIIKLLKYIKYRIKYIKQRREWRNQGGKITHHWMILSDYEDNAGVASGHYYHQDLLVAGFIFKHNPKRHIDIGSSISGFVSHVAAFREIEVFDIRPLPNSPHDNIKFTQADLMNAQQIAQSDSLSCLHAIEHFGLGRYGDVIDINGHQKAIENLIALVKNGGRFYISFPIGMNDAVYFNAHRIFHPETILSMPTIKNNMNLIRFDYVDDEGNLHKNVNVKDAVGKNTYGCGIYSFEKR